MSTLTLWQLKQRLAEIGEFDTADTNVSSILRMTNSSGLFFNASDAEEMTELRNQVAVIDRALGEAEDATDEMRYELNRALDLLAEIKDGTTTLAEYKERTEKAEAESVESRERIRRWESIAKGMVTELEAMRKKKGVVVGYIGAQAEVLALLGQLATYPNDDRNKFSEVAKQLISRIYKS